LLESCCTLVRARGSSCPVDVRVGVRAGQLLVGAGLGSEKAVDAFVVAAADVGGGAVIATVDKEDVEQLAGYATNVRVAMI
jgi:hypothetical protein